MFRLFRLCRILRLLRAFKELWLLVKGLVEATKTLVRTPGIQRDAASDNNLLFHRLKE